MLLSTFLRHRSADFGIFSKSGRLVITSDSIFGDVRIWHSQSGMQLAEFNLDLETEFGHSRNLFISDNGKSLFVVEKSGIRRIRFYDDYLELIQAVRKLGLENFSDKEMRVHFLQ